MNLVFHISEDGSEICCSVRMLVAFISELEKMKKFNSVSAIFLYLEENGATLSQA